MIILGTATFSPHTHHRSLFFWECMSALDHKPPSSTSLFKLSKLQNQKATLHLKKSFITFASSGLLSHESLPSAVLGTATSLFLYWFRNKLLSLHIFLGPGAVLGASFAQSKHRMHQPTIRIGSQETVIKIHVKSTTSSGRECKKQKKIVKCHWYGLSSQPIPKWVMVTQNRDH